VDPFETELARLEVLSARGEPRDEALLAAGIPALFKRASRQSKPPADLTSRLKKLQAAQVAKEAERHRHRRALIRGGQLRGKALLELLVAQPPDLRELFCEQLLGVAHTPLVAPALPQDLIDYHPSGVDPIVRAVVEAPLEPDDVLVDLGAGLGKVALLASLLSGARATGYELQPELAAAATARAADLGLPQVVFENADVRRADLSAGSVFFMYLPFVGAALEQAMRALHAVAMKKAIVLCALGVDLARFEWLSPRPPPSFWLTVYDSRVPGVRPRALSGPSPLRPFAEALWR
jgi:SAM-dependent methyltransferase